VKTYLVFWNSAQRVVQCFDPKLAPFAALRDAKFRTHNIIGNQKRIIDLQQKAGVYDGLVLFSHSLGDREYVLLVR
jgi:hypothetical protein